jgi:hypothetical protein
MASMIVANYERERELFAALLNIHCAERVLLFQGDSGVGKSFLLRSFEDLIPRGVQHIPIELRGEMASVGEIFYRIGAQLGWERLGNLRQQLFSVAPETKAKAIARKNIIAGLGNQINISLYSLSWLERSPLIAALTEALFADIRQMECITVFVFDTFDNASTETAEWLAGPLLGRVARSKTMRAIVAGQTVPDINNIEWGKYCNFHKLTGITNAAHWLPLVDTLRKIIPHDPRLSWLSGVCDALKGNPARIMQVIEALPSAE